MTSGPIPSPGRTAILNVFIRVAEGSQLLGFANSKEANLNNPQRQQLTISIENIGCLDDPLPNFIID